MKAKRSPVVMIHGSHCGPWAMDGFAGKFRAAGYEVECPALRFHEMETAPDALGTTSLLDYAADLEDQLKSLPTPAILIGHSLGGLLAQMLAARSEVRALVLLAPSAPWGVPPSTLLEIAAAQSLLLKVGFWNKILAPDTGAMERLALNRFPDGERAALAGRLVAESGRATFETLHWGLDMSRASEVETDKVTCPLLLLAGGEDRVCPPGTVQRTAALYRQRATFEKLDGMSHWLIGEPGWEKVADRALTWLDGI
jgi:pimeloyl-ACP methyl ester carboxylesterase